jgi:hypothetical protein
MCCCFGCSISSFYWILLVAELEQASTDLLALLTDQFFNYCLIHRFDKVSTPCLLVQLFARCSMAWCLLQLCAAYEYQLQNSWACYIKFDVTFNWACADLCIDAIEPGMFTFENIFCMPAVMITDHKRMYIVVYCFSVLSSRIFCIELLLFSGYVYGTESVISSSDFFLLDMSSRDSIFN